jgi:signal peptidase I
LKKKITITILGLFILFHAAIGMWWMSVLGIIFLGVYYLAITKNRLIVAFRHKAVLIYPLSLTGVFFLAIAFRVLIFGLFIVPSGSMKRTILPGDVIWVNKTLIGPRLPSSPWQIPWISLIYWMCSHDKSNFNKKWFDYYRLQGYTSIKFNDILVFNHPYDDQVLIKRCIACPGDTLQIKNSWIYINKKRQHESPNLQFYYTVGYNSRGELYKILDATNISSREWIFTNQTDSTAIICLTRAEVRTFVNESFTVEEHKCVTDQYNYTAIFPHAPSLKWTLDDYGPYVLPFKGMTISLNERSFTLYHEVIKNLENTDITRTNAEHFAVNNSPVEKYTFKNNYYFMMGDNRHNSFDSRYFGLVPESKIIGKASLVLFSNSKEKKWYTRLFKKLYD